MALTWIHYPNYKVKVEGVWQHKRLRVKQGAVWVDTIIKAAAAIDYSGIIASLNLLTDTLDTAYDGTDPTLAGMETALDTINGEIITP